MGDPHLFSYFGLADTASSTDLYEAYYERIGPLLLAGLHYEANYLKAAYTILLNRRDEYLKNRGRCGNRIRVFAEVKP